MSQHYHQQKNGEIRLHMMSEPKPQQENGNSDTGRLSGPKNDRIDASGIRISKGHILTWDMMFVVSGLTAVLLGDPLFFYLPITNEDDKCVTLDRRLMFIATCFRLAFDCIYVVNILVGLCRRSVQTVSVTYDWQKKAKMYYNRWRFIIDILAVLPIPQVILPILFSELRSWTRRFLIALLLLQYVPRFVRIYISWKELVKRYSLLDSNIGIKATTNIFVYILTSHVLGGIWYFFSIQREMACWHFACENHIECTQSSFTCGRNLGNYTFLGDACPVRTPNTTVVDFGIFHDALQSGIVSSTNISQKITYCFWWGLRNLSSLGQNLQTSINDLENYFSISISIFGLILLLYLIGKVQIYIQMITEKATKKAQMEAEKSQEIDRQMTIKKLTIQLWISRNQIPDSMKEHIFSCIKETLEGNKDFDTEKPIHHLSDKDLLKKIKFHLCFPLLQKVQSLKNKNKYLLQMICESLKPLYYNEDNCIIREGDPLNVMLFITQGSVWCFKTSNGENGEGLQCIEKGEFYGEELLEWGFNCSPPPKLSDFPISTKTVKTFTKVEAFALTASDLKILVARHSYALSNAKKCTLEAMRRLKEKKNEISTEEQQ